MRGIGEWSAQMFLMFRLGRLDVMPTGDLGVQEGLRRLDGLDGVVSIRGKGLMIGVQLDEDCGELVGRAMARGVLLNVTAGNVIRLLPPMVMSDEEGDKVADTVIDLVREWGAG